VAVEKVVCIPESGGCVELSLRLNENGMQESGGEVVESGVSSRDLQSIRDTVGKYIKVHIPEISMQSHPFSIFANPNNPHHSVSILFRPCGSFTKSLSKRLKALTLQPEPTPSEMDQHGFLFSNGGKNDDGKSSPPKIMVNGIRSATSDMLDGVKEHDRIVIVAGGVGIVSYISLLHAVRLQAIIMMRKALEGRQGNGLNDEYRDDEEDLENGGNGVASITALASRTKCIDVHWISRDEGLIQHVLQSYFVPFCSKGMKYGSSPISIRLTVHHTSSQSPSSAPTNGNYNDDPSSSDGEATTTWTPSRYQPNQQIDSPCIVASSIYEGNNPSLVQNMIPSITLASIVFGGLWIINYCYENIQDKNTVPTRLVAVVGIVAFALSMAILSNGLVIGGNVLHTKVLRLFQYSKLECVSPRNDDDVACGMDKNSGVEIECTPAMAVAVLEEDAETTTSTDVSDGTPATMNEHEDISGNGDVQEALEVGNADGIMSISHSCGRPNLSMIVREAMAGEREEDDEEIDRARDEIEGNTHSSDLGIFICGPTALTDSVWKAIKEEKENEWERSLCKGCNGSVRKPVGVYQEVFEL